MGRSRGRWCTLAAILAATIQGPVCLAAEGVRLELQVLPRAPQHLVFHPSNPYWLLIVGTDTSLWDVAGSTPVRLSSYRVAALQASFSPKGDLVATANKDGTVRLWNLDGSPRGAPLKGRMGVVLSVAFSPKGNLPENEYRRGTCFGLSGAQNSGFRIAGRVKFREKA